jgi:predicted amidohydrolase YtcJ
LGSYVFRSLLGKNARLTFGSDWPVAPLDPLLGIYAAVTRRTLDGKHPGGWIPQEKISLEEALTCYTRNNAYGSFEESLKGTLEKGKLADITVFDRDLFALAPEKIREAKVLYTLVDGKIVYQSSANPSGSN